MKKTIKLFSVLLMSTALLFSCSSGSGGGTPDADDTGTGTGTGTGTESGSGSESGEGSSGTGSSGNGESGTVASTVNPDISYNIIYNHPSLGLINFDSNVKGAEFLVAAEACGLVEGKDYTVDNNAKKITLTDSGYKKLTGAKQVRSDFDDCTFTITKDDIYFSNGEWTFEDDYTYHGINYLDFIILSLDDGYKTALSGKAIATFNLESAKDVSSNTINAFDSYSEDMKKKFIVDTINESDTFNMSVSTNDSITINGHDIKLIHTYTDSELEYATYTINGDFGVICQYANPIKTNVSYSKYVFDYSSQNEFIYIYKN